MYLQKLDTYVYLLMNKHSHCTWGYEESAIIPAVIFTLILLHSTHFTHIHTDDFN